jgi:V8-like Glu-specific endopeptidase
MRKLTRQLLVLAFIGSLVVLPGSEASDPASPGATVSHVLDQGPDRYWTPKRIARAASSDPLWRVGAQRESNTPLQSLPTLRHQKYPLSLWDPAIGKIVLRTGPYLSSCSGTALSTPSYRLVLTAAHCLYDSNYGWSRRIRFLPGYDYGRALFGVWGVTDAWIPGNYMKTENTNFDYGILVMRRRVGKIVSSLPFKYRPARSGKTRIVGYPGAANRGKESRMCTSPAWKGDWVSLLLPGPAGIAARCNMAGGSSGGPWLSEYYDEESEGPAFMVRGITSTAMRKSGYSETFSSPFFGLQFGRLLVQVERRTR